MGILGVIVVSTMLIPSRYLSPRYKLRHHLNAQYQSTRRNLKTANTYKASASCGLLHGAGLIRLLVGVV
jgi:hypothetical protein